MAIVRLDRASKDDGDKLVHDLHLDPGVLRQVHVLIPQLCSGHGEGCEINVQGEVFAFNHSDIFDTVNVQLGLIGLLTYSAIGRSSAIENI